MDIAARMLAWTAAAIRLGIRTLQDQIAGRTSDRDRGRRLRRMLEEVGGTSVKVGQQMALRVDLLPFEVCEELDGLLDNAAPFPLEAAREAIERSIGGPIASVFAHIEPEPIGSASIACVFRGTLHDGRDVAIKVRRPGVARQFQADLTVFYGLTRSMEFLTLSRFGFFHHLRTELWNMLINELDFRLEADLQMLFRKTVKEHGIKWVSAPKVHCELSNHEVLISEFISAVPSGDFLHAIETGDTARLEEYASQGIVPRKVACRLMELSLWGQFEAPFYHADPHPGNILLLPKSRIMLLDFGACGLLPHWQNESSIEFQQRMMDHDFGGASQMALATNIPLPYVDIEEVTARMRDVFWRAFISRYSLICDWWERTSAAGWQRTMEALGDFQIQGNAESLRGIRGNLLYETLVSRIDPSARQVLIIQDWATKAAKRSEYRLRRRLKKQGTKNFKKELKVRQIEVTMLLHYAQVNSRITMSRLPPNFRSLMGAAAFTLSELITFAMYSLHLQIIATVSMALWFRWNGLTFQLPGLYWTAITHPASVIAGLFLILRTWRRIFARLNTDQVRDD